MLQSDDEDNHYMAMKAFANLEGVDDYREELLFLWLYGVPDIEEWALEDADRDWETPYSHKNNNSSL